MYGAGDGRDISMIERDMTERRRTYHCLVTSTGRNFDGFAFASGPCVHLTGDLVAALTAKYLQDTFVVAVYIHR